MGRLEEPGYTDPGEVGDYAEYGPQVHELARAHAREWKRGREQGWISLELAEYLTRQPGLREYQQHVEAKRRRR